MITARIDMAVLSNKLRQFSDAAGLSLRDAVKKQSAMLVRDLVRYSPPASKEKLERSITREVRSVFSPIGQQSFRGKKQGHGDMVWMDAGPSWLSGVERKFYRPQLKSDQMRSSYKTYHGKLGPKQQKIGIRSKDSIGGHALSGQTVYKLNRIFVRAAQYRKFLKDQVRRAGLLKASWAKGWSVLQVKGRLPNWVNRHVASGKAKGVVILKLESEKPTVTLTSRARGVEHQRSLSVVRTALRVRVAAMTKDIQLYLKGIKRKAGFA